MESCIVSHTQAISKGLHGANAWGDVIILILISLSWIGSGIWRRRQDEMRIRGLARDLIIDANLYTKLLPDELC